MSIISSLHDNKKCISDERRIKVSRRNFLLWNIFPLINRLFVIRGPAIFIWLRFYIFCCFIVDIVREKNTVEEESGKNIKIFDEIKFRNSHI